MATITATQYPSAFTGAFNRNTLQFTITTGVVPTVTIESLAFAAVKTITNDGGLDTYEMDLTEILKQILGLAPTEVATTGLTKSTTIAISGAGATTVNITSILSYAVNKLGEDTVYYIADKGRGEKQYHYGYIWFYNAYGAGNQVCSIGDVEYTYMLEAGWNFLTLHSSHLINGKFTVAALFLEFDVYYLGTQAYDWIDWINRDGCWSRICLRKLTTTSKVEHTNPIPQSAISHLYDKGRSCTIGAKKIVEVSYDTIAKDATHFKLLTEIADSPVALLRQSSTNEVKIVDIASISEITAEYKQNLHFMITVQYEDYVAGY